MMRPEPHQTCKRRIRPSRPIQETTRTQRTKRNGPIVPRDQSQAFGQHRRHRSQIAAQYPGSPEYDRVLNLSSADIYPSEPFLTLLPCPSTYLRTISLLFPITSPNVQILSLPSPSYFLFFTYLPSLLRRFHTLLCFRVLLHVYKTVLASSLIRVTFTLSSALPHTTRKKISSSAGGSRLR